MKKYLLVSLMMALPTTLLAANAAQNLKALAATARTTNAAAIKAVQDAAIARMTTLLTAEANKGEERYALAQADTDFKIWATPAGIAYLVGRGFSATETNYNNGRVLEISWETPNNNP